MNKQAAKLAKTTALLNSTSIQLRISGSILCLRVEITIVRIIKPIAIQLVMDRMSLSLLRMI
jgi:hypothetical protein